MKRISSKKLKEEQEDSTWEEDTKFYSYIWSMRKHECYETGKWLGNEPLTVFFHHVLPKEQFPEYRHASWNILLISHETHDQVHMDMDRTPKIKKRYLELLEKHNTFTKNQENDI